MRKIILDVENTTTKLTDKYTDYSPYNPGNKLVSIGWANLHHGIGGYTLGSTNYLFLHHKDIIEEDKGLYAILLDQFRTDLKDAKVIIAHNAKYDISWLEEAGFDLSHLQIEDTMIREYVMARGRTDFSLRLADTCKRYGVTEKGELFEKYPDMQISEMPINEVEEYGRTDIQACAELYLAQEKRLAQEGYAGMDKPIVMMNEFCRVLIDMERAGVKIDEEALAKVELDFTNEAEKLKFDLNTMVKKYMGDTPVNLDSPAHLSSVIYSREIKDGHEKDWIAAFNIGKDERNKPLRRPKMSVKEFVGAATKLSHITLKTRAERCTSCDSVGTFFKTKKDGSLFKKATKCKTCCGTGIVYIDLNERAGFCMKPQNIAWTTVGGFSTNQTFLEELVMQAKDAGKTDAATFLEKLMRLSSVTSYLSTFVGGIKAFKQNDSILHPNYNQCITATGRLSSTKPNLQNQPREQTFPIRKVFISRFSGGSVTEVDFAQLEFRAAIHLAKDTRGKEDILNGIDIHNATAQIITEAGQLIGRQDAKSRTFKPLYGGFTGTEAERTYYRKFLREIYTGIGAWHTELEETAITKHIITIPTGRQFIFPDCERAWHGGCTKKTQVVNYPVQSFATADILPISMIRLRRKMKEAKLRSVLVLTTHDSCAIDTYPGEEQQVRELASQLGRFAEQELRERYGIEPYVPFDVEVKYGNNLMELKKAA